MECTEYLEKEKISKLLFLFSVPSVISLVLNALYNMVDQIFIGQGVGYLGNGATNVIFPLTQLAVAFGLLIGDGAASYINLKSGCGEKENAEKGMTAAVAGLLLCGIVLFILYNLFLEPLCRLFGATQATLPYALEYGRIISVGIIFCVFASGSMSIVRANGSPKTAMIGMIIGCAINLVGDPLAIFVCNMGVKGAAWATILGQFVNAVINLCYLIRCKSFRISRSGIRSCLPYIPRISKLGFSSFVTQMSVVVVIAVQNNLLVYYGAKSIYGAEIPMTALGVTMKIFTVLQCAVTGLASGAQPIISYNYGCRQFARVKSTLKTVLLISVVFLLAATVLFQAAPMSIIRIFGSSDPLYNEFSVKCLKIYLLLLVFDGVQMTGSSFLQSIGRPGRASLLIFVRQIVSLIPAMFLFAAAFGVNGILYAGPVASLAAGILSAVFLLSQWRKLSDAAVC